LFLCGPTITGSEYHQQTNYPSMGSDNCLASLERKPRVKKVIFTDLLLL
jgi:hypothetical protein